MLFRYKGYDKRHKTSSGFMHANDKQDAILKIKQDTPIIVITSLKETVDNPRLTQMRQRIDGTMERFNTTVVQKVNQLNTKKEKPGKKEAQMEKKRQALYNKPERKPFNLDNFKNFRENLNKIGGGGKFKKKRSAVSGEETILDKEAYYELLSMFKQREEEFGNLGQLTDSHVAPIKSEKKESVDIDWDMLEDQEADQPRLDVEERFKVKVKQKDIIMLTRRLQIMLASGVSLISGLKILADDDDEQIRRMLSKIVDDIQMGDSFSAAISKFPQQFDNTYVSLVAIGESSGSLDDSLDDIVKVLEQRSKIKKKIKGAATYPVIIFGVLGVVLLLGSMFFIPMFAEIFEDMSDGLPMLTEVVFNIADMIPFIAAGFGVAIGIFIVIKKNNRSVQRAYTKFVSRMLLKIPIVREVTNVHQMHSFASTIALMLKNGVRLSNSLTLAQKATSNVYIKSEIATASLMMTNGYTLSEALSEQQYFDSVLVNIIQIGEETGEMSFALNEIARFYSEELERRIETLMALIQPVSIIMIGLLAVPVVIAIYLPILDMSSGAGM